MSQNKTPLTSTWRKLTFRALTVTLKYLIWNKEFSRTRLLHNVLATFTRCRSSCWIMLLFPSILVTLTWYVTRFSWRNQWCIFNYSSPFRFTVSTLYQRRILETSGRRQSTVAVPFWSSSAATHSKLNLKIILWMDSRKTDYLQRKIFCLLSQQPRYSSGDRSRDISRLTMWQYTSEKLQRRLISEKLWFKNDTSNLSCILVRVASELISQNLLISQCETVLHILVLFDTSD